MFYLPQLMSTQILIHTTFSPISYDRLRDSRSDWTSAVAGKNTCQDTSHIRKLIPYEKEIELNNLGHSKKAEN